MARIQKIQGAPRGLAADEVRPVAGAKCRCRAVASVRYRNSYREADSCTDPECRTEAMAWVSNRPYVRRGLTARKVVMSPPQRGNTSHMSRDAGPRALPPGPRPVGTLR